eukprot:s2865_g7.t4
MTAVVIVNVKDDVGSGVDAIVVIGGASVFAQAMEFPNCTIQMTVVSEEFDSDEFFQVGKPFWCMQEQSLGGNQVSWWRRVQPEVYDQLAYWKAISSWTFNEVRAT